MLINTKTFIAHDSIVEDFSSCFVNCIINGNVTIKAGTLIGSNSVILEKTTVGRNAKISMGSVVTSEVQDNHVVLTKPSKSMFFGGTNNV